MELYFNSAKTDHRVVVTVEDGIVIPSVHNKAMLVASFVLDYTVKDGQWVVGMVLARGFRMKLDGTAGRKPDEQLYHQPKNFPDWVTYLAEHYRPKDPAPEPAVPLCVLDVQDGG